MSGAAGRAGEKSFLTRLTIRLASLVKSNGTLRDIAIKRQGKEDLLPPLHTSPETLIKPNFP
jgi:hypothetical protein